VTRKRVGLKEVAALAGTSVATVSRVLSGTGYASEDVRTRVKRAAETLNYQPNLRARALRQRASYTVGLLIPNLLPAYYTALADALSQLLAEAGYSLLLASSRDDPGVEREIVLEMVRHDVAGLLWVPSAPASDLLATLQAHGIPAVSLVRRIDGDRTDTVVFEDFRGSATAAHHLIDLGHRSIGYIGCEEHSSNKARWDGFRDALRCAGVTLAPRHVKLGKPCETWGETAAAEMLALPDRPTALYAASNALMPGVLRATRQLGLTVPDQLSLVCFDDVDWFAYTVPSVTAVSVSYRRLAETSIELLMRRVRDPVEPETPPAFVEIGCRLVVRESTAPPRVSADQPPVAAGACAGRS
jgi:LacI family transcriptional regulator